jgi:hypothetical protein
MMYAAMSTIAVLCRMSAILFLLYSRIPPRDGFGLTLIFFVFFAVLVNTRLSFFGLTGIL